MTEYKLNKKCPDCNKGISDEATRCNSCAQLGKRSPNYKHGLPGYRRLNNHCLDCRKEIDDRATYCSSCSKTGERHPCYRGGLVQKHKDRRGRDYIIDYAKWTKNVFERDNYQCQNCGSNKKLRAHHIYSYTKYPELQTQLENGITLCEYHHKQLHYLFGKNVKPKQLKWFLKHVK